MTALLASLAILAGGGLLALALSGRPRVALATGSASAALGSALGLGAALSSLSTPPASARAAWRLPLGELQLPYTVVTLLGLAGALWLRGWMR